MACQTLTEQLLKNLVDASEVELGHSLACNGSTGVGFGNRCQ